MAGRIGPAVAILAMLFLLWQYFSVAQQKAELDTAWRGANADLASARVKLAALERERRELSETFEGCRQEKQHLRDAAEAAARESKEQLDDLQKQQGDLATNIEKARSQFETCRVAKENMEKDVATVTDEREDCKNALAVALQQTSKAEASQASAATALASARDSAIAERSALEEKLSKAEAAAVSRDHECATLATSLQQSAAAQDALLAQVTKLGAELSTAKTAPTLAASNVNLPSSNTNAVAPAPPNKPDTALPAGAPGSAPTDGPVRTETEGKIRKAADAAAALLKSLRAAPGAAAPAAADAAENHAIAAPPDAANPQLAAADAAQLLNAAQDKERAPAAAEDAAAAAAKMVQPADGGVAGAAAASENRALRAPRDTAAVAGGVPDGFEAQVDPAAPAAAAAAPAGGVDVGAVGKFQADPAAAAAVAAEAEAGAAGAAQVKADVDQAENNVKQDEAEKKNAEDPNGVNHELDAHDGAGQAPEVAHPPAPDALHAEAVGDAAAAQVHADGHESKDEIEDLEGLANGGAGAAQDEHAAAAAAAGLLPHGA